MLALPPHVTSDIAPAGCTFKLADGSICPVPKHFARGFCEKHYRSLKRSGAFAELDTKPLTPHSVTLDNSRAVLRARRKLAKRAPEIVDILMSGIKNASVKGDTSGAQWALLHTRVVAPVNTTPSGVSGNGGVIVNIGVKVSGTDTDK